MLHTTYKNRLLFIFLLFTFSVYSQDLKGLSESELKDMKSTAIENRNFDLAHEIKLELESRKSIEELIEEKDTQIKKAVQDEDFGLASDLKEEKKRLEEIQKEVSQLESNLDEAIKKEDFGKASQIQSEIKDLKLTAINSDDESEEINDVTSAENDKDSRKLPENKSEAEVVFNFTPMRKNIVVLYDIYIDGNYVGSLDIKNKLVISNLEKGKHKVRFMYEKVFDGVVDVEINENTVIDISGVVRTKLIEKNKLNLDENSRHHKSDINENVSIIFKVLPQENQVDNDKLSQKQDFKNISFPSHDSPFKAKYSTTSVVTNIPSYFNSIFNYGHVFRNPINKNIGLIYGFGIHATFYRSPIYNGNVDMLFSGFGLFGYRFEFSSGIFLRPDLELGLSDFANHQGHDFFLHAKWNVGFGIQFGKSRSFGLLLEPNYQYRIGPGFSIGLVKSLIPYPEKRHLVVP